MSAADSGRGADTKYRDRNTGASVDVDAFIAGRQKPKKPDPVKPECAPARCRLVHCPPLRPGVSPQQPLRVSRGCRVDACLLARSLRVGGGSPVWLHCGRQRPGTRRRAELSTRRKADRLPIIFLMLRGLGPVMCGRWGGGLTQQRNAEAVRAAVEAESSRPFARYADDKELDAEKRSVTRWGDPLVRMSRLRATLQSCMHVQRDKGIPAHSSCCVPKCRLA